MTINVAAVALSGAELVGANVLQGIFATSPQRSWMWNGVDINGAPELDSHGQPVPHFLFPQVTLEERHTDSMRLTDHPVEQGAEVTDHAYKLPAQVQIKAGWAFGGNNPPNTSIIGGIISAISSIVPRPTDVNELRKLYNVMLRLQTTRALVTLVTGKRNYQSMMLETLAETTDQRNENALVFVANFKEIIIARTFVTTVPLANVQQNPQITGATQNMGQTALKAGSAINTGAANSILSRAPVGILGP